MGKIIDKLKKILSMGTIEEEQHSQKKETFSKVTNKVLLHELLTHFEQSMEELSVGKRILYPMSFNILMHPDDYNQIKESMPFVLPEVISQFYSLIKREKDKIPQANYTPPATYWFFQISACKINEQDGEENIIERGKIITTGSLTTFDIVKAQQNNMRIDANIQLSVKCQNSNTNDNNINMQSLLGMDILSEGTFKFPFNMEVEPPVQENGMATLRWAVEGGNAVYTMLDDYIDISGATETRKGRNICIVNSDAIITSHVQIRYDKIAQTFQLAAYAKTRLNSREVPLSSGSPIWVTLPKHNSSIFLNDAIKIEFNANSN